MRLARAAASCEHVGRSTPVPLARPVLVPVPSKAPWRDRWTSSARPRQELSRATAAGLDAALIVTAFGIIYSLIAYAELGPTALPFALLSTTVALLIGGAALIVVGRDWTLIAGPSASGALVVASIVRALQHIDGARGSLEAAIVATTSVVLIAGLVQALFAKMRLGSALKFVPYPVLMGFTNTVALLLIVSMIPAALGHAYTGDLADIVHRLDDWRPTALLVTIVGTATGLAVSRWLPRWPAAFAAAASAAAVHHLIAAACPTCLEGACIDLGVSLRSTMPDLERMAAPFSLGMRYWGVVIQGALVLAILNALFSLLNAALISEVRRAPVDGNRLMRSLAAGNVSSGCLLGLPVAVLATPSLMLRHAGPRRAHATATYFVVLVLVFGFGRRWFDGLPLAAIASAVFTSARILFDPATWPLIRQALSGRTARRAAAGPLAVATLVVATGFVRDLYAALFVGALAAVCLLALELRRSVVLTVDDLRTRRSRRVRSPLELERLDALGTSVRIVVLGHWLYFGTADEVSATLEGQSSARWVLLDLREIAGIDVTAARSLVHAARRLRARGTQVVIAGLPRDDVRRHLIDLFHDDDGGTPLTFTAQLDDALEQAEDDLIGVLPEATDDEALAFPGLTTDEVRRLHAWLEPVTVSAAEVLFRAGDPGDALFVVRRGRLTIWLGHASPTRRRLLTFGPGGLFGELALLDRQPRSADAVADIDCELWMLTRERLAALAVADHALHAALLTGIALHLAHRMRANTRLLDLG